MGPCAARPAPSEEAPRSRVEWRVQPAHRLQARCTASPSYTPSAAAPPPLHSHLPSLSSAECSHIQGSFEATGGHVTFSCSVNIPYEPAVKAAKKAAQTAKSKALALRDYMTKPPPPKPTKRITPERVSSSPQDTESYAEFEQLPEEEKHEVTETLGSADNPIFWEPTCSDKGCNQTDDTLRIRYMYDKLDFDAKFIQPLHCLGHQKAVTEVLLPALRSPCHGLKASIDCYSQGISHDHDQAAANAVVLYRRHSPQIQPYLTADQDDLFHGLCNYLLCLLRNAGYHVTHTAPQQ